MGRISKFVQLSASDKLLYSETLILLGLGRAAVRALPFRWVASVLGQQCPDFDEHFAGSAEKPENVVRISEALSKIGRQTPWDSNCLAKAIAGQLMLRRRKIASSIYFGMLKDEVGEYLAHAWLRSRGTFVTGESEQDEYTIVAKFVTK